MKLAHDLPALVWPAALTDWMQTEAERAVLFPRYGIFNCTDRPVTEPCCIALPSL